MSNSHNVDPQSQANLGKTDENIVLSFLKSLVFLACVSGALAFLMSIQP